MRGGGVTGHRPVRRRDHQPAGVPLQAVGAALVATAVAAVLAAALFFCEREASHPLIDVRMLAKHLPLQRTYLRQMLTALGTYAVLYGASQWMEQSKHLGASTVGLILIPLSAISIVMARVVARPGWG